MCRFNHLESNCIQWIPIMKNDDVLVWGSGNVSIINELISRAKNVVSFPEVDCNQRSMTERLTNIGNSVDIDSLKIEFQKNISFNKFRYIFLIGALERASLFFPTKSPEIDMLSFLSKYLTSEGFFVLVCANKFGLKYWGSCAEGNSARLYEGLEDYPNFPEFNSFTKAGIEKIAKLCDLSIDKVRYLYPDYHLTYSIYSDSYLPRPSSLYKNQVCSKSKPGDLFSQRKVFDNIVKEDLFPVFSNSFLFILSKKNLSSEEKLVPEIIYSKYSNFRSKIFQIRTDIIKAKNGSLYVEKNYLCDESRNHLFSIYDNYLRHKNSLSSSKIYLNRCEKFGESLRFDFLHGPMFSEYLYELMADRKYDLFKNEIVLFFKRFNTYNQSFIKTEAFKDVFGDVNFDRPLPAAPIGNIDVNFENVFMIQDEYHLIDYEWFFDFPIPMGYLIHGSLDIFFNHLIVDDDIFIRIKGQLLAELGITDLEAAQYRQMWLSFEKYMLGEYYGQQEVASY